MLFSLNHPLQFLVRTLFMLPIILISLTVHEIAHGFISYKLGDSSAKYMGRLSINPLRHVDPFGLISLILFGFGWAKPVMINPQNYKNPKAGTALTALAGPVSNFLMALIGVFGFEAMFQFCSWENRMGFLSLVYFFSSGDRSITVTVPGILMMFLYLFTLVNIGLGIFNLIPIPPLDGSKILYAFLPNRILYRILPYERYFGLILIVLLFIPSTSPFGFLSRFLSFLESGVFDAFDSLALLVFGGGA